MTTPDPAAAALIRALRDKPTRDRWVAETVAERVAYQIRALREVRGWTQTHLATLLQTTQSHVSLMERPTWGRQSLSMLIRIARVFDVALIVRFSSFGEALGIAITPVGAVPLSFEEEFGESEGDG